MLELKDVFRQALTDSRSVKIIENGYQSVSLFDVKIIKDDYTHEIDLLNTSRNYYTKLTEDQIESFKKHGWKYGVYVVTLLNYSSKLDNVEKHIRDEVNGKNSDKTIKQLKSKRESFMTQYTQLNNKLNDTKNKRDNI
jgi:hypothetical protein